jgi:hypothetical protein
VRNVKCLGSVASEAVRTGTEAAGLASWAIRGCLGRILGVQGVAGVQGEGGNTAVAQGFDLPR